MGRGAVGGAGLLVVVAAMWSVGAGWELNGVRDRAAALDAMRTTTTEAVVTGRDVVGFVALDVVRYTDGGVDLDARLAPTSPRAPVGSIVTVEVPADLGRSTAAGGVALPIDHADRTGDEALAAIGRRASLLTFGGLVVAVLATGVASWALSLAWPEVKRQTTPYPNRYGT